MYETVCLCCQMDMRDCGVAALASIAKHYGSDFSLAHLENLQKRQKRVLLPRYY